MKKIIITAVVAIVLLGAGGGWYVMAHRANSVDLAKAALQKGDLRAAGIELRTAVRDDPSNREAHALLSQVLMNQGDAIAAEKEMKRASELGWNVTAVQAGLAQAYLAEKKWKEIRAEIPRSGSTPAQTAYFLMVHAVAERAENEPQAAQATIAQAERADPGNPEVQVNAARFAIADNDRDLAMKKLDRALEIAPNRLDALSLKAQLMAAGGDRSGAIALLDRAIQNTPTTAVRLERASLLMADGQTTKAQEDIKAVLDKEPKNPAALYLNMVALIRTGKFADADVIAQRLDPVINQFQRGLYFKAMVKANVGQIAQAEDSAISYVSRYPTDADGVRLLARIELNTGHPARAIPTLVNIVNAGQNDPETLDLLGRAYAMDGNRSQAEEIFKKASTGASSNAAALTRVASSRLQVGDLAGAATDLERSLEIAPAQPGATEALFTTALAMGDLDRAQQALDRLKQQQGDSARVGYLAGLLKLARLDTQGALDQFTETARKFPDYLPAKLSEARLLLQPGRAADAEKVLDEILTKNPAEPEALSLMVQALSSENRSADAVKYVERARAANPNNVGIVAGQAQLYAALNDMPHALQTIESLKVDGKTPVSLLPLLARVQVALGKTDEAKQTLSTLVAAQPSNVDTIRLQVTLLAQMKDLDGARQAAQEGLQRIPGNLPLMEALVGVERDSKGPDAALALADQLRANPANMPAAAMVKGDLLMALRRPQDAAAAYSDEFKRDPSSILLARLGGAESAAGNQKAADDEFRRWLDSHPQDAVVAQVLAAHEIAERNFTDAERLLQIVLAQQPRNVVALNNMAWVYQQQGDKRARQFAQRAYLEAPTPEVGDTFAWILVSQGEPAKALPILQTAAAARPGNPEIRYHLAVALKDLNRRDEALAVIRPLVESTATFDEKPAAEQLLAELSKPKP